MNSPVVSVVMPVFNGEKYLKEAIGSILTQSLKEFELLLIDDGSIDNSNNIVSNFKDKRIVYIKNVQNIGLASTLNLGITLAKSRFIARMDQDDIANVDRLRLQYGSLEKKPQIGVCGTNFHSFGVGGEQKSTYPLNHDEIFTNLLFHNCIAHPTVMFRKSLLVGKDIMYDARFDWAEDFELWTRLRHETKFINLRQSLLSYRINATSMTASGNSKVHSSVNKVNKRSLNEIGIDACDETLNLHRNLGHRLIDPLDSELLMKTEQHLLSILLHNNKSRIYNEAILKGVVSELWNDLLLNMSSPDRKTFLDGNLSNLLNSEYSLKWRLRSSNFKRGLKSLIRFK